MLDRPRLTFSGPRVTQLLPTILDDPNFQLPHLQLRGSLEPGAPPVMIRFQFTARRQLLDVPAGTSSVVLSPFRLSTSQIYVYQPALAQTLPATHYTLDVDARTLTFLQPTALDVRVSFVELYPSYQCSTSDLTYGPVVLLDAERPHPDGTEPVPLRLSDGYFPVLDEFGRYLGLDFRPAALPHTEGKVLVDVQASANYGEEVELRIEVEQPGYFNALRLRPSASFPQIITRIETSGLDHTARASLFEGELLFDREFTLRFPSRLVRRIYVQLRQENYTYKEYEQDPPDKPARDARSLLQPVLPKVLRQSLPSLPVKRRGAHYSFGVQDVGVFWYEVPKPSVAVTAPLKVASPEVVHVEYSALGDVRAYLETRTFDATGVTIASTAPALIASGTSFHFLPVDGAAHTKIYLKFVLSGDLALLENYSIQASNRV